VLGERLRDLLRQDAPPPPAVLAQALGELLEDGEVVVVGLQKVDNLVERRVVEAHVG
jgi:hypothetical protein